MVSKIWYSFQGGVSEDDEIGFYDKAKLPWVKILEENWTIIAEEIESFIKLNEKQIKPYFDENLVSKKNSWRAFTFFLWKWKMKKNIKQCPETDRILQKIPNILSASVSIMESGVKIKPHRGDTNAIMRAHLALKVPASLPECGFKVKYEERSWEEGNVLVFNDAARHEAWNLSKDRRYILLVDVLRPEFSHKKYQVCSLVWASLIMQLLMKTQGIIKHFPSFIKKIMLLIIAGPVYIGLRIRSIMDSIFQLYLKNRTFDKTKIFIFLIFFIKLKYGL